MSLWFSAEETTLGWKKVRTGLNTGAHPSQTQLCSKSLKRTGPYKIDSICELGKLSQTEFPSISTGFVFVKFISPRAPQMLIPDPMNNNV